MNTTDGVKGSLDSELVRLGVPASAVVVPTPWDIGAANAYLFPGDPVTFVDCGVGTPVGREALAAGLAESGRRPSDVARVIVTHAHMDHLGGAAWLQEESGCRVYAHPDDIAICDPATWPEASREIFGALGFSEELMAQLFDDEDDMDWSIPSFEPLHGGDVFEVGDTRLVVEHHPGHSPGHVWVVEGRSGSIFTGDYLLVDHPTNAGLEIDRSHPTGRAPLLSLYNAGLGELMERDAPALFPGHGGAITGHREVVARRLAKTERRTRHVLEALGDEPETALDVGRRLYGARAERSWEIMSDLVGRLDLLVEEAHAVSHLGEDGAWYFRAR